MLDILGEKLRSFSLGRLVLVTDPKRHVSVNIIIEFPDVRDNVSLILLNRIFFDTILRLICFRM